MQPIRLLVRVLSLINVLVIKKDKNRTPTFLIEIFMGVLFSPPVFSVFLVFSGRASRIHPKKNKKNRALIFSTKIFMGVLFFFLIFWWLKIYGCPILLFSLYSHSNIHVVRMSYVVRNSPLSETSGNSKYNRTRANESIEYSKNCWGAWGFKEKKDTHFFLFFIVF